MSRRTRSGGYESTKSAFELKPPPGGFAPGGPATWPRKVLRATIEDVTNDDEGPRTIVSVEGEASVVWAALGEAMRPKGFITLQPGERVNPRPLDPKDAA